MSVCLDEVEMVIINLAACVTNVQLFFFCDLDWGDLENEKISEKSED